MINDEPLQYDNGKSEGEITHSQASEVLHADIAAALANLSDLDKLYERTMVANPEAGEESDSGIIGMQDE